jgi:3-oxoacyl-[acyl-carrier-protein] synthase-3
MGWYTLKYENVCIEGTGFVIPDQVVTSAWFEDQLRPIYERLRIKPSFFERITGIKERRWWEDGVEPSDGAAMAGKRAMENAGINSQQVDCVINASVCRDYIEPATAVYVHHKLGLRPEAQNFDMVNACLGFLSGMLTISNMIELGQIKTGLVVAAESPKVGQLATICNMLNDGITREDIRDNLASFTLGAASVAMILTHRSISRTGKRLLGGAAYSGTHNNQLCVAQRTWMRTDSTALLEEGVKVVLKAWDRFLIELGWTKDMINRMFTHQVSEPVRRSVLKKLGLPNEGVDYPNLSWLGNTASVAAPLCFAQGIADGILKTGDKICLLGAGSGVNSLILGIQW